VALTAHAMKGDRERCLDAGMDAYVSKPLRVAELFEVIARVVPVFVAKTPLPIRIGGLISARPLSSVEAVFDPKKALARVEGDEELLRKMIDLFFSQSKKLLPEIRWAGERGDGKRLERSAHKLKGSMGSFGARSAVDAALRLEIIGVSGDFSQVDQASANLEYEVTCLREALTSYVEEGAPCAN
jgi:CheY-like chemotaxis protein